MTYDQNEGLGAAMAESASRERIKDLENRVRQLELQVRQLIANGATRTNG